MISIVDINAVHIKSIHPQMSRVTLVLNNDTCNSGDADMTSDDVMHPVAAWNLQASKAERRKPYVSGGSNCWNILPKTSSFPGVMTLSGEMFWLLICLLTATYY